MSIAGKRAGLNGSRSNLFFEAIRIIKEMREATNGKYPRYGVWENVCGALSSNKGEGFRAVLEAFCSVKGDKIDIPRPEKWTNAGEIVADDSIAWRVLDAQYWGVPQRRKRIFLVADFGGQSAGKILFESEGVSGYSAESFRARQRTAGGVEKSSGAPGVCLNDQGGSRMDVTKDVTATLRAEAHHPPCVMSAGFCTEHSAKARSIGYEEEKSPTLRAGVVPACVFENHSADTRYTGPLDVSPTISANLGMGGNNQPFVVKKDCFDVRFTSEGTKNARQNCYETDTARTIDTSGNAPENNQGGVAVVESYALQGSMIGREDKNGPQGNGVNENVSFTLNTADRHAVAYSSSKNSHHTKAEKEIANTLVATDYKDPPTVSYGIGRDAFNQGKNAKFKPAVEKELQPTLVAKGPGAVQSGYTVRRLTPTECARLQGFPDWWCAGLGTENPTEEDMTFWREVFKTYAEINEKKPRSDNQIRKWLQNPYTDAAEYKMWGNGVALPCVYFVLAGIAYYADMM